MGGGAAGASGGGGGIHLERLCDELREEFRRIVWVVARFEPETKDAGDTGGKYCFFSLSLNVAPPLLPYVQNVIQNSKKKHVRSLSPL